MDRRKFLQLAALGSAGALPLLRPLATDAAVSDLKVTRVRVFNPTDKSDLSGFLNLGNIVVAVDTDAGITGYGQGGTPDLIRYPAGRLIGEDPLRIEYHWQRMYSRCSNARRRAHRIRWWEGESLLSRRGRGDEAYSARSASHGAAAN